MSNDRLINASINIIKSGYFEFKLHVNSYSNFMPIAGAAHLLVPSSMHAMRDIFLQVR